MSSHPLFPTSLPDDLHSVDLAAENVITQLTNDIADVKDNLIQAKAIQPVYANRLHGQEVIYQLGDKVMLTGVGILSKKGMIVQLNVFLDRAGHTQSSVLTQKPPCIPLATIVLTHTLLPN